MTHAPTKLRATLAAVCAAVAACLLPAPANADQYIVDHCTNWDLSPGAAAFGNLTNPVVSSGEVPKPVVTAFANDCGVAGGGLHLQLPSQALPADTFARVALEIPADRPNIQIERVQSEYAMSASTGGPVFLTIYAFNPARIEVVNAMAPDNRQNVDRPIPPGTRLITWNVFCSASACSFGAQDVLEILRTRLYLNESVAPSLTVTGGSISRAGAKSGQMSLGFDAADSDSGVASATVTIGGIAAGSMQFACPRKDWSVCPRSVPGELLNVDTTTVPNGDHELVVSVRDAANNVVTRSLGTITVANGPASLPNGANPSRLAKITARFTTTKARARHLSYTARPSVKGRLVNETGQPIAGATVVVLAKLRSTGSRPVQIASATTGADGVYSVKLPNGASRTLTFAYTAFSTDARPATTAILRTTVRAIVSASVAPRSVRAGERIALTGRLRLLPRKGIEVNIQARDGRRWRTVDAVHTTRTGSFRWPYRFKRTAGGRTFAFRARVASATYPFAAANSKTLTVRVR